MHKSYQFLIIVFGIVFSTSLLAQTTVAVVDIERAVNSSNYAKEARKKLENSESYQKRRGRYNELGKELKAMEKEVQVNALTWSDEQKKKHNEVAKQKLKEINQIGKQLELEVAQANKKMEEEVSPKIEKIINEIIKEKKIDVLLKAQAAHFAAPAANITKELLDRLNKAG